MTQLPIYTDEHVLFRQTIREFVAAEITPFVDEWDEAGEFPRGSMRPKIEAATDYVEATGRPALITDVGHLRGALEGADGTRIVP